MGVSTELPANVPVGTATQSPIFVVDLGVAFPQAQDPVFRNLAVNARYQCMMCDRQVKLKWGQMGDDETITFDEVSYCCLFKFYCH